jgi:hypothetical protein
VLRGGAAHLVRLGRVVQTERPLKRQGWRVKPLDWDRLLVDGYEPLKVAQRVFRHLPREPRCKLCQNPFGGIGGKVVGLSGREADRSADDRRIRTTASVDASSATATEYVGSLRDPGRAVRRSGGM